MTLSETIRQADTIVVGTVVDQKTRWGNEARRWMVTDYTIAIEDVIHTSAPGAIGETITVSYWGGTLDGETQAISDARLPSRGERLVLMLKAGWRKELNFSPVVGLNQGLFSVSPEAATVRDADGSPLMRQNDGTVVRRMPRSDAPTTAPAVELHTFTSWLRANLAAIKAAPSELPAAMDPNDPRVLKVFSIPPAPDQPTPSTVPGEKPQGRKPRSDARDPSTFPPNASIFAPPGVLGRSETSGLNSAVTPHYAFAKVANLPIVVNNLADSFKPWSPEDEYQLSKWNYYANVFQVYATPTGDWAWNNNRFDLCGFPSSADMQSQFGAGWDAGVIGICYIRTSSSNIIVEADIALNPVFSFTLDDEWVYNGASARSFRQVLSHELGHMWGLDHQSNSLSVMNDTQDVYRFFGLPFMDDAEAVRAAYPSAAVARTDLGVYLYHASGYKSYADATFPSSVSAGGTLTVNNYEVENVGTTTIATPRIEWFLTSARNYDSSYYPLGETTYGLLNRFQHYDFATVSRTLTVPGNVAPGSYYLGAFIRAAGGASQTPFPFSNNYAFSRGKIQVLGGQLSLLSAISRKAHGSAGIFSINLPLNGTPGIESRNTSANHQLQFIFSNSVTAGSLSVTAGQAAVSGAPSFSGKTMTVNLTGVADRQTLTLTLKNVTDTFGHVLPNTSLQVIMLIGDTTGNGIVGPRDVRQTRARFGKPIKTENCRSDVTCDGAINSSDVALIKSRF